MSFDKHRIFVCTTCCHEGGSCRPGYDLIRKLQHALSLAGPVVGEEFELSGVACLAGCSRPCTVAFRASGKATYLFGDIDPETDIDDLVAFADRYRQSEDGWSHAGERPGRLRHSTLARIPAAMIVTEAGTAVLS